MYNKLHRAASTAVWGKLSAAGSVETSEYLVRENLCVLLPLSNCFAFFIIIILFSF